MHCWNCGNKVEDNSYICLSCGVKLNNTPQTEKVKDSSTTLGIIGLCFALFIPVVSFICSGLGTGKAYQTNNKTAKTLNIIALSIALVSFIVTNYLLVDVVAQIYKDYFNIQIN